MILKTDHLISHTSSKFCSIAKLGMQLSEEIIAV
jgi:hypothetical protein